MTDRGAPSRHDRLRRRRLSATRVRRLRRKTMLLRATLWTGAIYGFGLLAAGWVCGPIRVLVLAPRFGVVAASLAEGVAMGVAILVLAHILRAREAAPRGWPACLGVGLLGVGLVLIGEVIGAQVFFQQAFAPDPDAPESRVGLALLVLAVMAPLVVSPRPRMR